ncbi:MAG: right-handed parallel beta-helix repeat-containing protein [Kiritimatiellae bacterium]|nr:right-handed parallel beta-helix repeat-containing protein [Kiritimatiellia bacterium]
MKTNGARIWSHVRDGGSPRAVLSNVAVIMAVGLAALSLRGAEFFVSTNGSHTTPFTNWTTAATNIQAAVDVATNVGDVVWVTNGTYRGGGAQVVLMTRNITLQSVNGYSGTIIDGDNARRGIYMSGAVNNGLVDGFTVTNCSSTGLSELKGAGVYIRRGTVRNCLIAGNRGDKGSYGGGACLFENGAYLRNSIVSGNTNAFGGGGVVLYGGGLVENCLIVNNGDSTACYYGGGVLTAGGVVQNCTIARNTSHLYTYGGGLDNGGSANQWSGTVTNCIIWGNTSPDVMNNGNKIMISYSCVNSIGGTYGGGSNNIALDPLFVAPVFSNYRLLPGSPCKDAGAAIPAIANDLDNNPRPFGSTAYDMGAYEQGYYSMVTNYVATNGSHVAPFTHWMTAATNIQAAVNVATNLGGNVVLVSNGVYRATGNQVVEMYHNVLLKSVNGYAHTIIDGDNARRGINMSGTVNNGVVDGFTITNCNSTGIGSYGGGVFIDAGILQNCLIAGNTGDAGGCGAGVCLYFHGSSVIRNCVLEGNKFGGSAAGYGGGLMLYAGGMAENCLIRNNASGGYRGGGACLAGGPNQILRNCTVVGNSSTAGSGVANYPDNPCTVQNCIIWDNTGSADLVNNGTTLMKVEYSCVKANTGGFGGGAGNITDDPLFVNPGVDYHVRRKSPCVDTGETLSSLTNDLAGAVRPMDGNGDGVKRYDMGAYETPPSPRGTVAVIR